ncbi:uncharacterized protein RAG0_06361 [Rhynchosporium agropyri]|uniref:Uncharacterized protein n=2 Tax=Rhynchosporium TaxID=38037 RepID=A0A1E1M2Y9_RHYSE|nr:uncharacterized protein RAG0_06361 [Rhynchosporium agropyri]CZT43472.1 uncharacterized protein RSE6_03517 [Rhynchosporium secalis]
MNATSLALNEPFDRDSPFKQIGIAFLLPSGIGAALKQDKLDVTINILEVLAGIYVSSTVLDVANVAPSDHPSMVGRKVKAATTYKTRRKSLLYRTLIIISSGQRGIRWMNV